MTPHSEGEEMQRGHRVGQGEGSIGQNFRLNFSTLCAHSALHLPIQPFGNMSR